MAIDILVQVKPASSRIVKRKVGYSDDDEEEFTPAPGPLKTGRGRGRPRKSVAPADEAPTPAKATDTAAPKKRGRPKRTIEVVAEPAQTETPPESSPQSTVPVRPAPKKRGRKPNVSVEKHNQDEGGQTPAQ